VHHASPWNPVEQAPYGRLNGPRTARVDRLALRRQGQEDPTAIAGISPPPKDSQGHETDQEPRHGTGVQVQGAGQLTRRQAGSPSDDSDDQPLRAGHAEAPHHASGHSLQSVIHGPHHAKELEDVSEWLVGSGPHRSVKS
jgi:hypothetical protein